ncbi:AAA family ATPase [Halobacillus andaensis]|uniref:ATP-binding protein n=1 Tax=Halobacillus andaensis TaxID=1176239 RepID=UPI003D72F944
MKLLSLEIYGFGKWKNYSLSFSKTELNIIAGANEAGKSTLQHFILFVLFGLPPKQRAFYQPKTGGTVGGRITVHTTDGEVTIERVDDRNQGEAICWLSSGEKKGEVFLKKLLGGLSKSVYQSIYSFNADDLNQLQRLTGEELGEVLLNVGLTGSDQIYQAEKNLDKQLNEQFKPKGRNPSLNQKLTSIEELEAKRNRAEKEVGEYQLIKEKLTSLDQKIEDAGKERDNQSRLYYSYLQLNKAIPAVQTYHQLIIDEAEWSMPPRARPRMQEYQEQLLPLQSELKAVQENLSSKIERLNKIDTELVPVYEQDLQLIIDKESVYQRSEQEDSRLERHIQKLNEEIDQEMKRLDLAIDKEELKNFEFPFYLEETWKSLKEERQQIDREEEQLCSDKDALQRQEEQTNQQLHNLRKGIISEQQAVEHSELIDRYIHSQHGEEKTSSNSKRTYLLASIALLGGIFLSLETAQVMPLIIAVFTAAGLLIMDKKEYPGKNQPEFKITKEMYTQARQQLQQYEQAKGEAVYLQELQKEHAQKKHILQEQENQLERKINSFEQKMEEQLQHYPFLQSLKLAHWEKLYHLLKQLQDKQHEIVKSSIAKDKAEAEMQQIKEDVNRFFAEQNWEHSERSILEQLNHIKEVANKQIQLKEEYKKISEEIRSLNEKEELLEGKICPLLQERNQLIEEAGAINISDFYEQLDHYDEEQKKKEQKLQFKKQIEVLLTPADQEKFQVWNSPPTETEIAFQLEQLEREVNEWQEQEREFQQEKANYEHQIHKLESSDELSQLNHQLLLEKNEFREKAKQWASFKIALDLLTKTKEMYQNQYLPNVLVTAEAFFTKITHGRYESLHFDGLQQQLIVKNENGFYFTTEELSRGTADQLYVSLRLALAKTLSEEFSVPFLVDDAFVNFDEERLTTMLHILKELSTSNQVLLFTWREDVLTYLDAESVTSLQLSSG